MNEAKSLLEISRSLATASSTYDVGIAIEQSLKDSVEFDSCWIGVWEHDIHQFDTLVMYGMNEYELQRQIKHYIAYMGYDDIDKSAIHDPNADQTHCHPNDETAACRSNDTQNVVFCTIINGSIFCGVIYVSRKNSVLFSDQELMFLRDIGRLAGGPLQRAMRTMPIEIHRKNLRILGRLAPKMVTQHNLYDTCSLIADELRSVVNYSRLYVDLASAKHNLVCRIFAQDAAHDLHHALYPYYNSTTALLKNIDHAIVLRKQLSLGTSFPDYSSVITRMESHGWKSGIAAPIYCQDELVGSLQLRHQDAEALGARDVVYVESAATLLAVAITCAYSSGADADVPEPEGSQVRVAEDSRVESSAASEDAQLAVVDSVSQSRKETMFRLREMGWQVGLGTGDVDEITMPAADDSLLVVLYGLHAKNTLELEEANSEMRRLVEKGCGVVALVDREDFQLILDKIDPGVGGILHKMATKPALRLAIHQAVRGGQIVDYRFAADVFRRDIWTWKDPALSSVQETYSLTPQEWSILLRIRDGASNRQIGDDLNFAAGTVKNKVSRIYQKLGVANRSAAMALVQHMLIRSPSGGKHFA